MTFVQIVSILGMIPLFSMRTFLPAFLAALFLRYPQYFPGMGDIVSPATDSFITKDWVLYTLGGLSLLEIVGDKSTEIRNFLKDAETYLKPLIFFIINLNLLDEASVEVLGEVQWAAFDPLWILLLFGTLAVHWLAGLRRDFISFLEDVDEDDNFYISKISSWLEDSLVIFGFLLLIWLGLDNGCSLCSGHRLFYSSEEKNRTQTGTAKTRLPQLRKNEPALRCKML